MTDYEVYQTYLGIKLHFTSDYDYVKYNGKVNASLQAHFEKVGETMAEEWSQKAGSRGAEVLSAYK